MVKGRTAFAGDHRFTETEPQRKTTPEPRYQEPNTGLWDVIFGRKDRKLAEAKERYESDLKQWKREESCNAAVFSEQMSEWKARKEAFEAEYAARKQQFLNEQAERNAKVDVLARGVSTGEPQSVVEHATLVLEKSTYDDLFEKSFEIDYVPEDRKSTRLNSSH